MLPKGCSEFKVMKIAQVSPLFESVPPKLYGGTERVVHFLTEELVAQGHEVTLFASSDSDTSARLISHIPGLRLSNCADSLAHHLVQLQEVMERSHEFDLIHFHTDYLHFPVARQLAAASVATLHGRLDLPELLHVYNKFSEPVISISHSQRGPLPQAQWMGTVYHGLPANLFQPGTGAGGYLAFLGRMSPEKGPVAAIEIARRAGMKLKMAAKVDKADLEFFKTEVEPLLDHPLIEFIGEINEEQKQSFLGNAAALLFPINWCEPFGMVMIESMACGTPVIAFPGGSVPEVVASGFSGFIVNTVEEAVSAVEKLPLISRAEVRAYFEGRFLASRMAKDYVEIFENLVRRHDNRSLHTVPVSMESAAVKIDLSHDAA